MDGYIEGVGCSLLEEDVDEKEVGVEVDNGVVEEKTDLEGDEVDEADYLSLEFKEV